MPPAKSNKFKTSRFPAARIKRIMQLDEEVGKLASATPVMISKSLECFIQVLLDESCKTVREAGARKLTAGHLKLMINTNPSFDFLRELTESIADLPSAAASGAGPSTSKARKASTSAAAAAAAVASGEGDEDNLPGMGTAAKRAPRGAGKGKQPVTGIAGKGLDVETWAKGEQERLGEGGIAPGWGGGGAPIAGTGEGWTAMPWSGSGSSSYPPAQAHALSQSALPTLQPPQHQPQQPQAQPQPEPEEIQQQQQSVTMIGSWKQDMTGGGGTGEGGRGMFDDYEEDEDDY